MQTPRKIDIAENVEEIKLICILASINNCPIHNQPEFCHHEASDLATISVFPLGVRNMGAFPHGWGKMIQHAGQYTYSVKADSHQ